ncbi:BTB/POZ domain-containing protein At3g49900 isoform X2 [Momordica charantia]|uniref:BTB/POZ domain-containing protein At3g49900 isoform X2 n=1 Tax=Momordica charantia TaxID=3673 RepID=A0A6J1BTX2_MOMCH|nr:BTB/POZ domain-containing protein At3g49900 isoform X2 [Momordica charantia]
MDPLASKSRYLKRQLGAASDVTVNPPLKITAETFSVVADFCYGGEMVITPLNVAALRTAGELLEMSDDETNLVHVTEKYFRRVVAVNRDYASVVFRSCLELLPEAETTAFLGSRCLEAWSLEGEGGGGGGDGDITCFQDFKSVEVENFLVLASSLNRRFKCHDLVYKIALLYLKGYSGKMTEEQKVLICNFIDCDKLSPKLLLHAVQNPLMPLRFIVRAMLIEQLNTRHSIFSTTATSKPPLALVRPCPLITKTVPKKDPLTLGAILKRDAAARESAKLKAAMRATNSRIRTLENELTTMKLKLHHSENQNSLWTEEGGGRSASFHFGGENNYKAAVARGERGSTSSTVFRLSTDFKMDKLFVGGGCKPVSDSRSSSGGRSFGRRLIEGIRNAFRPVSRGETGQSRKDEDEEEGEEEEEDEDVDEDEDDDIVVMRRNQLYVS